MPDWERSCACAHRIFAQWAFDIHDLEGRDRREIGFIPWPMKMPTERVLPDEGISVHRLTERIEAIDTQNGLPFAWFLLMTHGQRVDPDVGHAIAAGLDSVPPFDRRAFLAGILPDGDIETLLRHLPNEVLAKTR
ncbi:hypothetical protein [Mesorhizobium sp. M0243]|uniref:hypothetical protein n=1 Tax=Mesorhizobium sp. M0243 TaxID=2956925 RepID=UPI003335E4D2